MARGGFRATNDWPRGRETKPQADAVQELGANHTLIVGQSRSGKTNAARRLIEEILLWTEARIVLFDPNGDFLWLKEVNPDISNLNSGEMEDREDFAPLWNERVRPFITVASKREDGAPWGIPWGKLTLEEMAAFLNLDPAETFAEYQVFRRHYEFEETRWMERNPDDGSEPRKGRDLGTIRTFKDSQYFKIGSGDAIDRYRLRLESLEARPAWALTSSNDLDSLLRSSFKGAVIDLSMGDEEVRAMTAARALEVVWKQGEEYRTEAMRAEPGSVISWPGTIVVIDEAHLFAAPGPLEPRRRLLSDRIERFADQGKKFNLYLMLITQQPNKLNQRILAECSNRVILRMNERLSLRLLEETYGGIRGRYDGALTFSQGEALLEGALLCDENPPPPMPRGVLFLRACTREGGATPPRNWARPKINS